MKTENEVPFISTCWSVTWPHLRPHLTRIIYVIADTAIVGLCAWFALAMWGSADAPRDSMIERAVVVAVAVVLWPLLVVLWNLLAIPWRLYCEQNKKLGGMSSVIEDLREQMPAMSLIGKQMEFNQNKSITSNQPQIGDQPLDRLGLLRKAIQVKLDETIGIHRRKELVAWMQATVELLVSTLKNDAASKFQGTPPSYRDGSGMMREDDHAILEVAKASLQAVLINLSQDQLRD
jgi:hypothetical protein